MGTCGVTDSLSFQVPVATRNRTAGINHIGRFGAGATSVPLAGPLEANPDRREFVPAGGRPTAELSEADSGPSEADSDLRRLNPGGWRPNRTMSVMGPPGRHERRRGAPGCA